MNDAKSGSNWTTNDLQYRNLAIVNAPKFRDFFGIEPPELPQSVTEFCNLNIDSTNIRAAYDAIGNNRTLLRTVTHLYIAIRICINAESSVGDFAVKILELCEYDEEGRAIGTRPEIIILVRGETYYAKPDVYVHTNDDSIVLLVQEDKNWYTGDTKHADSKAQVVAEAVAAYQHNRKKDILAHRPTVIEQRTPYFAMLDTYPIFITATEMLSQAVSLGHPSPVATQVKKYSIPPAPGIIGDALYNLDKRRKIMQAFIAFKRFL
ncbi:hypothetical protein BGX26_012450 [Mortierella sp. AD094]|nr:hypothetical protein BGX26_012450 [Mortierella sp. AD094]